MNAGIFYLQISFVFVFFFTKYKILKKDNDNMRKREKRTNDDCMNSFLMIENHSTMLIRKDVLLSLSSSPFPHERVFL